METTLEGQSLLSSLAHRPRHVHTITDRFSMTNTYLIDDGHSLIVVDPNSVLNARLTLRYLQHFLHRRPTDVDLIVLTRLPQEHMTGLEFLCGSCHAPVAASIVPRYLHQRRLGEMSGGVGGEGALGLEHLFRPRNRVEALRQANPFSVRYERLLAVTDLWLEDAVGLPNHPDWRVIVCPGQTIEGLCFYNPFSYELLCGDTMVVVEGNSVLVRGGANNRQFENIFRTLSSLKVHYLYPIHGRPLLSSRALARASFE